MAKYTINDTTLVAIADAIRAKSGTPGGIDPASMAALIEGIQTGSDPVVQPLTVTENGTYTAPSGVDGYNPVTVNVAGSGGETIENGIVWDEVGEDERPTKVSFFTTGTTVPEYTFYNYHAMNGLYVRMTECHIPETITQIKADAFDGCSSLVDVNMPDTLQRIDANAFYKCSALKINHIPKNVTIIGNGAFSGCTAIDKITILGTPWIGSAAFTKCTNLLTINVPWAEGAVSGAPWGATNATINYNYTGG